MIGDIELAPAPVRRPKYRPHRLVACGKAIAARIASEPEPVQRSSTLSILSGSASNGASPAKCLGEQDLADDRSAAPAPAHRRASARPGCKYGRADRRQACASRSAASMSFDDRAPFLRQKPRIEPRIDVLDRQAQRFENDEGGLVDRRCRAMAMRDAGLGEPAHRIAQQVAHRDEIRYVRVSIAFAVAASFLFHRTFPGFTGTACARIFRPDMFRIAPAHFRPHMRIGIGPECLETLRHRQVAAPPATGVQAATARGHPRSCGVRVRPNISCKPRPHHRIALALIVDGNLGARRNGNPRRRQFIEPPPQVMRDEAQEDRMKLEAFQDAKPASCRRDRA